MGIISGLTTAWNVFKGFTKVKDAVQGMFGGKPGEGPAPSLTGQKPNLSFARGRVGLGEGSGLMAGRGNLYLDRPTAEPGNEWINTQAKYLAYLNMAEAFEEPGKVRRAIKLTV